MLFNLWDNVKPILWNAAKAKEVTERGLDEKVETLLAEVAGNIERRAKEGRSSTSFSIWGLDAPRVLKVVAALEAEGYTVQPCRYGDNSYEVRWSNEPC